MLVFGCKPQQRNIHLRQICCIAQTLPVFSVQAAEAKRFTYYINDLRGTIQRLIVLPYATGGPVKFHSEVCFRLGLAARAHIQQGALWVPPDVITRRFRQAQLFLLMFCREPMCPVPCGPFSWDLPTYLTTPIKTPRNYTRTEEKHQNGQ